MIAIEPAPRNVKLLRWNVRHNNAPVEVRRVAAASSNGIRQFLLTDSSDSHGFYRHPLIAPARAIQVPTVTLDSSICHADFIKIDVEGAELDVLAGANRLLDRYPTLVVEWFPAGQLAVGRGVQELPYWLSQRGYGYEVLDELTHVQTTVESTLEAHSRGVLPSHWYANLCCWPL